MHKWYQLAHLCVAYLDDAEALVVAAERREQAQPQSTIPLHYNSARFSESRIGHLQAFSAQDSLRAQFRASHWFERGWTFQELIAPRYLIFVSRTWHAFGTKDSLADIIEDITGIAPSILTHKDPLDSVTVAQRMSWASDRKTAREEDRAYSLMGTFGVNMPTIYGEGSQAFVRLQEILRRVPDSKTMFI